MDSDEIKKLNQRIKNLEDKLLDKTVSTKPHRKKSDYNIFVQEYIAKNKDPKKSHKELFGESAKAWSNLKLKL